MMNARVRKLLDCSNVGVAALPHSLSSRHQTLSSVLVRAPFHRHHARALEAFLQCRVRSATSQAMDARRLRAAVSWPVSGGRVSGCRSALVRHSRGVDCMASGDGQWR